VSLITRKAKKVLTRNRLGPAGVGDVDELLDEDVVLVVVPVAEDDCELFVVGVGLLGGMDEERGAQTINVLARGVCVDPVRARLA
jgi:hypothetical protein